MVIRMPDVNPRISRTEIFHIKSSTGSFSPVEVKVKRGCGSVSFPAPSIEGVCRIDLVDLSGKVRASSTVEISNNPEVRELSGTLTDDDLYWDSLAVIRLIGSINISNGSELTVSCGTRIEIGHLVNLFIRGDINCNGTFETPVVFTSIIQDEPWGEIRHYGSSNNYSYTFFTNGGGDPNRFFGHSDSQPVIAGDDCEIELDNCFIIDNPGKGIGGERDIVTMNGCLISRCDVGAEFGFSLLYADSCYFLDIPSDDEIEIDDDNDALHLSLAWNGGDDPSVISNSVFMTGKDDGIDQDGANVLITNCVIDGYTFEGVAASRDNNVEVFNTLVVNCEQGIEAGWGSPQVVVDHCVLTGNETGLRFGDWYTRVCSGYMTITNTISWENSLHPIWNYEVRSDAPVPDAILLSYSLVNDPEYDSCEGCIKGEPQFSDDYRLAKGSVGIGRAMNGKDMGLLEWGVNR